MSSRGNEINANARRVQGRQTSRFVRALGLLMLVATHRGCDSIPVASVCFTENNMRNRPKIQLQKSNCFPAKSVFPFPLCRTVKSLIKPGSPPLVVHREEVCVVGGCISNENPNLYPKRNFPDFLAPPKKGEFWEILFRPSPVQISAHDVLKNK